MNTHFNDLAVVGLNGGEIILISVVLMFLLVGAALLFGLVYLVVRLAQHRPQPPALPLSPQVLTESQRRRDAEHIKLLSVFHFVFAGLAVLGIAFLFAHYFLMHTIFSNPDFWKGQRDATPPPKVFLDAFVWFYV